MKQRLLIADRDAELCEVLRRFLTERGYEVETSTDGLDCLAKLRQVTPAVLVLDLELLWGGGDGVLAWLREEPQFLPSRVVLTSAEASAHILDSLASPPVVKTLTKPFPLSALLEGPALVASDEPKHPSNGGQRRGILVVDDEPADRAFTANPICTIMASMCGPQETARKPSIIAAITARRLWLSSSMSRCTASMVCKLSKAFELTTSKSRFVS